MNSLKLNIVERQYLRNYVYSQRRMMVMCFIIMFVIMNNFMQIGSAFTAIMQMLFLPSNGGGYESTLPTLMLCVCFLSFLIPLFQFRFIMKRGSCDLYFSLPITRKRLFALHFISGGLFLAGSSLLIYVLAILLSSYPKNLIQQGMVGVLIVLAGLSLYSLFSWIIVKCNTIVDYFIVSVVYIILPIIIFVTMVAFASSIADSIFIADTFQFINNRHIDPFVTWMITNMLSPVWLMRSILAVFSGSIYAGAEFYSCVLSLFLWIILSGILFSRGMATFANRKGEDCEQRTNNWATYPILIPLITICLLFIVLAKKDFWGMIPFVFVAYLIMHFIANRSIRIKMKTLLRFALLFVVAGSFTYLSYATECFGTIIEKPDIQDVERVSIQGIFIEKHIQSEEEIAENGIQNWREQINYTSDDITDKQTIKELLELQDMAIDAHVDIDYEDRDFIVTFDYNMNQDYRQYCFDDTIEAQELKAILEKMIADGFIKNRSLEYPGETE